MPYTLFYNAFTYIYPGSVGLARLEEITKGVRVKGLLSNGEVVTIRAADWRGSDALEVLYERDGNLGQEIIYRDMEDELEIVSEVEGFKFDADGSLFRLVSEALRIKLAYLFDPVLAVHTSLVEPLPHQITAVYDIMLRRQPLRFLLADDPGAGKTIMAGLLIKELVARGDVQRCLICCPGSLSEQWQDEMYRRFHMPFEIITRSDFESSLSGNPYEEKNFVISRMDHMARNDRILAKLRQTDWDIIVVDEAHKMSATYAGGEVHYTKRYHLGKLLSSITRHFLLMTATPHNGKDEDFQLFMALLDPDRFEGRYRKQAHSSDVSDLMRRMLKEDLLKFDGTPLFPERRSYTVEYDLSPEEMDLYLAVTDYVREEFNRADQLEGNKKYAVGFALTLLQRRLASSPEAIYQSLRRRRERLQKRLQEVQRSGSSPIIDLLEDIAQEDLDDLEEAPEEEQIEFENQVVDRASSAKTIAELEAEIEKLRDLEGMALDLVRSGNDRKWNELSNLLQSPHMLNPDGTRRKIIVFTEHLDTLRYLRKRISNLLGNDEAVVAIHGGMSREDRMRCQEEFVHNPDVHVLVATDAAGEGINLQRANLLVNYDLPWNPNRLEQRFGRIHRIGQTEVCHMWNLVAKGTREGEVYLTLLTKLDQQSKALGGKVFDVLGSLVFNNRPLRDILVEAIRYGDRPEVRQRLHRVIDTAMDVEHLRALIEQYALVHDSMDISQVRRIRQDMERAEARRLQPHFIGSFFVSAYQELGGSIMEREPGRYRIPYVPQRIRDHPSLAGKRRHIARSYERITFDKQLINVPGAPPAEFVCPGHPLLDTVIEIFLEGYRRLLTQGAVLVDPLDQGLEPRMLFYLEDALQDQRTDRSGGKMVISRRLHFVEVDEAGNIRHAGYAPYLDYRPLRDDEKPVVSDLLDREWLRSGEMQAMVLDYVVGKLSRQHLEEVRSYKQELVKKTMQEVRKRLLSEINYWDMRASELEAQEKQGRGNPNLNSERARQRADELRERLRRRTKELEDEMKISPLPPKLVGAALVLPAGLLAARGQEVEVSPDGRGEETERIAMEAVMEVERRLGYHPVDVSSRKVGYDIESRAEGSGKLRFIEVKGRKLGADTITVTKNEILTCLNKPEDYILAIVQVGEGEPKVRYLRSPFQKELDFGVTSVNYSLADLLARSMDPS